MADNYTFTDGASRAAQTVQEMETEKMSINMGPSHPSTHGVLRLQLELNGETVVRCDPVIGYLHRGDEKIAENMTYNQFVPYTDRLDYLAPLANNVAYAMTVEKLAQLELPPAVRPSAPLSVNWPGFPPTCSGSASMAWTPGR